MLTLGRALDRVPDDPEVHAALGRVWLDVARARGDEAALARALESLQRVAEGTAASSEVLSAYGQALWLSGQAEAAERVLQEAVRRFPIDPAGLQLYADVAEARRNFEEARGALVSYDALVSDDEGAVRRARRIAALSMRIQDPQTAAVWFARVVDAEPDNVDAVSALIEAQLAAGRTTDARAAITQALSRHPNDRRLLALARDTSLQN